MLKRIYSVFLFSIILSCLVGSRSFAGLRMSPGGNSRNYVPVTSLSGAKHQVQLTPLQGAGAHLKAIQATTKKLARSVTGHGKSNSTHSEFIQGAKILKARSLVNMEEEAAKKEHQGHQRMLMDPHPAIRETAPISPDTDTIKVQAPRRRQSPVRVHSPIRAQAQPARQSQRTNSISSSIRDADTINGSRRNSISDSIGDADTNNGR